MSEPQDPRGGLFSIEEYLLPLTDITLLLEQRKFLSGTAFYRVKFHHSFGFPCFLAVLCSEGMGVITLIVPQNIHNIDVRIRQLAGQDFTDLDMDSYALDQRTYYFESNLIPSGWLSRFLRHMQALTPHTRTDYEGICLDGSSIYGDILVLNDTIHSFFAHCSAQANLPYHQFAWQFFHLGLLSFQEMRSLKSLAAMMIFL